MPEAFKYVLDAVVAAALFMALVVVFALDWYFTGPARNTLEGVTVKEEKASSRSPLKLAVTPTARSQKLGSTQVELWDDMGKLLKELGAGYAYDTVTMQQIIEDPKRLSAYDVVFLTCSNEKQNEIKDALVEYVSGGGILYASDWRYNAVAKAFPDVVAPSLQGDGDEKQTVEADIVDPALREALRATKIPLKFDLAEWKTAAFTGPRVKVLLEGTYKKYRAGGQFAKAPLMVRFQVGKGTVIFTSFHNEKQNSEVEKKLLQYLVFSLVTAGVDADINAKMDEGGFTPKGSNLLSTPQNQTTEPKKYENKNPCTLRFALGFRGEGAVLRFNIKSPDGKQYTHEAKSTVVLEVANAAAGEWTYTVTSVKLPHENFAFTVTVGEKK